MRCHLGSREEQNWPTHHHHHIPLSTALRWHIASIPILPSLLHHIAVASTVLRRPLVPFAKMPATPSFKPTVDDLNYDPPEEHARACRRCIGHLLENWPSPSSVEVSFHCHYYAASKDRCRLCLRAQQALQGCMYWLASGSKPSERCLSQAGAAG